MTSNQNLTPWGGRMRASQLPLTFTRRAQGTLICVISARDLPYQSLIKAWLAEDMERP